MLQVIVPIYRTPFFGTNVNFKFLVENLLSKNRTIVKMPLNEALLWQKHRADEWPNGIISITNPVVNPLISLRVEIYL